MIELIDYQAQRIEALERELALLRKQILELAKQVEVTEPIILPNL